MCFTCRGLGAHRRANQVKAERSGVTEIEEIEAFTIKRTFQMNHDPLKDAAVPEGDEHDEKAV